MILFQSKIAEHQQLAEHYRELAAKREALAQSFIEVQSQAQTDLGSLKALLEKCSSLGVSDAIASLKNAVLSLFGTDDGNDGGNQPTPTPDDDPDEPELLCLNGETGDCLTTADLDGSDLEPDTQLFVGVCPSGNVHTQESPDNPLADDHVLSSGAELNRQTCSIDPDLHWQNSAPDGSAWEIATHLVCLLGDILEEGDVVEVLSDRYPGYKGHVGTLKTISRMSELSFCIKFANGHVRYYPRTELKFVAKGEPEPETQPGLHTGQVLMGNRVVTTGAYVGVTRRSRIANARRGTADKVAARQLVRDGLSPEQALAVVQGEPVDDASDF